MTRLSNRLFFWAPRILGLAFVAFLALFATDVFSENLGPWQTAMAFLMHALPAIVLLMVLVLAWRWEWIGALMFAIAAALYIAWLVPRSSVPTELRLVWAALIALPALLIAALFLYDWQHHDELHAHR